VNCVVTVRDDGGGGGEDVKRLPAVFVSELPHQSEPYRSENASNLHMTQPNDETNYVPIDLIVTYFL
jgi:hypothetical protein